MAMRTVVIAALASALAATAAISLAATRPAERMPPVSPENYDAAQREASEDFLAARKTPVFGPFSRLIRSPEVMTDARAMGDYLRYRSAIGTTLSEFVILVTAREWGQDYEWSLHAPIAMRQGVRQELVQAISDGRRPDGMSEDEAICYDFSVELHRNKRVSDATYARALHRFGEKGVVDLTAINGYYAFLAMQLNMMRAPAEPGGPVLPRFPD